MWVSHSLLALDYVGLETVWNLSRIVKETGRLLNGDTFATGLEFKDLLTVC